MASQHDTPTPIKAFRGKSKTSLSWAAAGTESLKDAIVRITESGNSIMFTRNQDGNAIAIAVYSGNTKAKEYIHEVGDIPALLAWAIENFS